MVSDITAGGKAAAAAAELATEAARLLQRHAEELRACPGPTATQTVFAPLNDYAATVIGMVRDDVPFNTALSADILYISDAASGLPAVSTANNNHYAAAETNGVDLQNDPGEDHAVGYLRHPDRRRTAGLITTLRRRIGLLYQRHQPRNVPLHDDEPPLQRHADGDGYTRPSDRIRQDVARSPGGDSRIFVNQCVGCHSGMDPMAQAFAYYNYDATSGQMVYTARHRAGEVPDQRAPTSRSAS